MDCIMLKLPIGLQSFESLRTDGFAYVDKTKRVYDLTHNGKYVFLSRPRRFGKSLFLSTLKAYFEGKKDVFDGLAIAELEQEWETSPVLYLDLNVGMYNTSQGLIEALNTNLSIWEHTFGFPKESDDNAQRFRNVIWKVATKTGKKVVILVDEYDKPLIEAIDDESLQQEFRNMLKAFYGNLKTCDEYIRFAMLTGVSKFSKISLFSDLNNLMDISLDERYADICGLTANEIEHTFSEHIEAFAQKGIEVCVHSFPSEKNGTPAYCTVSSDDERFMDIKFKVIEEELYLTAYEDSATSIDVVE